MARILAHYGKTELSLARSAGGVCSIGIRSPRASASLLFCVERISFLVFDKSMYDIWKNVLASEYKRGKKR